MIFVAIEHVEPVVLQFRSDIEQCIGSDAALRSEEYKIIGLRLRRAIQFGDWLVPNCQNLEARPVRKFAQARLAGLLSLQPKLVHPLFLPSRRCRIHQALSTRLDRTRSLTDILQNSKNPAVFE